jgi:flagellar hook-length control protein FliK
MQTLPAPVSQTKTLGLADVASQSGVSYVNRASAENAKSSFQAELNRQVRAKQGQTQAKQAKGAEPVKSPAQQKVSVKDKSEVDSATSSTNQNIKNSQADDSFLNDLNQQLEVVRDLSGKVILNETNDVPQTIDISATTDDLSAVAELISTLGIPFAQRLQGGVNTQQATSGPDAENRLTTTLDLVGSQKNSMATLNSSSTSVLAEAKTSEADPNTTDVIAKPKGEAVIAKPKGETLGDMVATKNDLKPVADDLVFNKTMLNQGAKYLPVKDAASNIIQAQVATVSAVQNNNSNLASQQLASSNMVSVYPGKSGWDQAISQKVVWMLGAGQQSASLTLNPPDLGPLKVVINVHNDQADTTFISDNDEVRKALESGMSHLRDKMSESGIQLGQANVSTSQQQQEFQQAAQNRVFQREKDITGAEVMESGTQAKVAVRVSDGLVDTFA